MSHTKGNDLADERSDGSPSPSNPPKQEETPNTVREQLIRAVFKDPSGANTVLDETSVDQILVLIETTSIQQMAMGAIDKQLDCSDLNYIQVQRILKWNASQLKQAEIKARIKQVKSMVENNLDAPFNEALDGEGKLLIGYIDLDTRDINELLADLTKGEQL